MLVKIGTVTKPQGLRGEFRVNVFDEDYFYDMDKVFIDTERKVEKFSLRPKFAVLKVEGVNTCEEAEELRGLEVKAEKRAARALKKGEYLISDLIDKKVVSKKGKEYGTLVAVDKYGAADVFTVKKPNGKEFTFPHTDKVIVEVNENIVVDEKILAEVGMDL